MCVCWGVERRMSDSLPIYFTSKWTKAHFEGLLPTTKARCVCWGLLGLRVGGQVGWRQ